MHHAQGSSHVAADYHAVKQADGEAGQPATARRLQHIPSITQLRPYTSLYIPPRRMDPAPTAGLVPSSMPTAGAARGGSSLQSLQFRILYYDPQPVLRCSGRQAGMHVTRRPGSVCLTGFMTVHELACSAHPRAGRPRDFEYKHQQCSTVAQLLARGQQLCRCLQQACLLSHAGAAKRPAESRPALQPRLSAPAASSGLSPFSPPSPTARGLHGYRRSETTPLRNIPVPQADVLPAPSFLSTLTSHSSWIVPKHRRLNSRPPTPTGTSPPDQNGCAPEHACSGAWPACCRPSLHAAHVVSRCSSGRGMWKQLAGGSARV